MQLLASVVDAICNMLNVAGLLDGKNYNPEINELRRVMRGTFNNEILALG